MERPDPADRDNGPRLHPRPGSRTLDCRAIQDIPQLQEGLAPGDLERKWTKLSQVSGGFRKVKDAVIAHQGGDQQLVLVAVAFGQATTNLFVIFDASGRIINVDISRDFV